MFFQSPVEESQADGGVEGSIKIIQGPVRTIRVALLPIYRTLIHEIHHIEPWLIREAAESINRHQVGQDGKTRRKITDNKWLIEVVEFRGYI